MEAASQTTISQGLVGFWYFRYGLPGVIQGALLFGFLARLFERALQRSEGRPMRLLFSLAVGVWLFRCFRSFRFPELYEIMIAAAVITAAVMVHRSVTTRRA